MHPKQRYGELRRTIERRVQNIDDVTHCTPFDVISAFGVLKKNTKLPMT